MKSAAWAVPCALLMLACAPEPPCGLRERDVREADCQHMVAAAAACLDGSPLVEVPVTIVAKADYVASERAAALTPDELESFHRWNAGFAALGMAPAGDTPEDDREASASWVGGFYSEDDKTITLLDDGGPLNTWGWVSLLAHEYVHALQDARADLNARWTELATDFDRSLAFGAMVEGEATYVGDLATVGFFGIGATGVAWRDMFDRWQRFERSSAKTSQRPVTLARSQFHYAFGSAFVKAALDAGGWDAVQTLLTAPPSSTRQVMAGFGAAQPDGGPWVQPLTGAVPVLGEPFVYLDTEREGAWLFQVFLDRLRNGIFLDELPGLLRDDALSLFRNQVTDGVLVVWRLAVPDLSDSFLVQMLADELPAARSSYTDGIITITAASDQATLDAAPFDPTFGPVPPAPASSSSPAPAGAFTCVHVNPS